MANRPGGYGLTAECTRKLNAKYSEADEEEIVDWIKACTKIKEPEETGRLVNFQKFCCRIFTAEAVKIKV